MNKQKIYGNNRFFYKVTFIVIFASLGMGVILLVKAGTSASSLQPEDGQISSPATIRSDKSASGGRSVMFGSPAASETIKFHTCYPYAFCDTTGKQYVLNGFNIRQVGQYPKFTTLAQMQKIRAKGFNVVRMTLYWDNTQPSAGSNGFNTTALNNLHTAVANAKAAGLYVILDPIHGTGKGTSCAAGDSYVPAWAYVKDGSSCLGKIGAISVNGGQYLQKIASEYKDDPTVVAIDLANEIQPLVYSDDAALLSMYNRLINSVRSADPNTILIIEPHGGDKLLSASTIASTIANKSNILYSFHDYYGGSHSANGSLIAGCTASGYTSSGTICGNYTYENQKGYQHVSEADLDAHVTAELNMLADSRLRWPLFVGEYNTAAGLANADQWRKDTTAIFKKHNLSRTAWDFFTRGSDQYKGDAPNSNMSATEWGDNGGAQPGSWKLWVNDLL